MAHRKTYRCTLHNTIEERKLGSLNRERGKVTESSSRG